MVVLLLALTLLLPVAADASGAARACVIVDDPADLFALHDVVFTGEVVQSVPTGVVGDHVITHVARFKVDRIWKGTVTTEVEVGTTEPFDVGQRYAVFAGGSPRLNTSLACETAEIVSKHGPKLRWLLERPSRPAAEPARGGREGR